jgi:hypothetical protein
MTPIDHVADSEFYGRRLKTYRDGAKLWITTLGDDAVALAQYAVHGLDVKSAVAMSCEPIRDNIFEVFLIGIQPDGVPNVNRHFKYLSRSHLV